MHTEEGVIDHPRERGGKGGVAEEVGNIAERDKKEHSIFGTARKPRGTGERELERKGGEKRSSCWA